MRYINKELPHFKKRGEDINYAFLSEAYNEDDSCYYGLYYDDFKHFQHKRKDAFIELLREEQYDLCCYCMKNIFSDNNITLEHIIPQSCNKKKIRFYQTNSDVLNKYVELTEEFIKSPLKPQSELIKYPHLIAYTNLTISCKGVIENAGNACLTCNGPRGNTKIIPLMLLPDCLEQIAYGKDGRMYSRNNNPEIKDTIESLNLNYDRLQEIRSIWYLVGKKQLWSKMKTIENELPRKLILSQLYDKDKFSDLDDKTQKYSNEFYWNTLLKYKWFYGYYLILSKE